MSSKHETGALAQHTVKDCEPAPSALRIVHSAATPSESPVAACSALEANEAAPGVQPALGLMAARALEWNASTGRVTLLLGTREVQARLLPVVDPVVIKRAIEISEYVIVQPEGAEWLVIGVLRTCATPGIDVGDDYTIQARRVRVKAEHELTLSTGLVELGMRAFGSLKMVATEITSRARGLHRLVGMPLKLN